MLKKMAFRAAGVLTASAFLLTACAPAGVKDAAVTQPLAAPDFSISPDYSTNWWKDQPNGNSTVDPNWNGEGWILTANEVSDGISILDIKTGEPIKSIQGNGTPHSASATPSRVGYRCSRVR